MSQHWTTFVLVMSFALGVIYALQRDTQGLATMALINVLAWEVKDR